MLRKSGTLTHRAQEAHADSPGLAPLGLPASLGSPSLLSSLASLTGPIGLARLTGLSGWTGLTSLPDSPGSPGLPGRDLDPERGPDLRRDPTQASTWAWTYSWILDIKSSVSIPSATLHDRDQTISTPG